jgi:hypothetical protein
MSTNIFEATLSLISKQSVEAKAEAAAKKLEVEATEKLREDAFSVGRQAEVDELLNAKDEFQISLEAAAREKRVNDAINATTDKLAIMLNDASAAGLLPSQLKSQREAMAAKQANTLAVLRHHKMIS